MDAFLLAIAAIAAILFAVVGLALPRYSRRRRVHRRLRSFVVYDAPAAGARRHDQRAATPSRAAAWLGERIDRAKVELTVPELLLTMFVFACGTTALALAIPGAFHPVGLAAAPFGAALPLLWLHRREALIQRRFREQLADTAALLANALHAGLSFTQAIQQVVRESPEPTRSAFEIVMRELALGAPQALTLERLADRHPSEECGLIVAAINVQQQIGGNLPRLLESIAVTLRERTRIAGEIAVLTSQQRYSAYVLAALPIVILAGLFLISPDYVSAMFEFVPTRYALLVATVLVIAGFVVMRRMSAVDV